VIVGSNPASAYGSCLVEGMLGVNPREIQV